MLSRLRPVESSDRDEDSFEMHFGFSPSDKKRLTARLARGAQGPSVPPGGFQALRDAQLVDIPDPAERQAAVPLQTAAFLIQCKALDGPVQSVAAMAMVETVLEDLEFARQMQAARLQALVNVRVAKVEENNLIHLSLTPKQVAGCSWWGKVARGDRAQVLLDMRTGHGTSTHRFAMNATALRARSGGKAVL